MDKIVDNKIFKFLHDELDVLKTNVSITHPDLIENSVTSKITDIEQEQHRQ